MDLLQIPAGYLTSLEEKIFTLVHLRCSLCAAIMEKCTVMCMRTFVGFYFLIIILKTCIQLPLNLVLMAAMKGLKSSCGWRQ